MHSQEVQPQQLRRLLARDTASVFLTLIYFLKIFWVRMNFMKCSYFIYVYRYFFLAEVSLSAFYIFFKLKARCFSFLADQKSYTSTINRSVWICQFHLIFSIFQVKFLRALKINFLTAFSIIIINFFWLSN